ncbi:hypothetical protein CCACVL1_04577 [Corchorus capsularis]|uniref:Pectinesterase inhibitor n=1 Tax=Corchorus capsularis TaxID=210143 RepID=A0A1R3JRP8_COCAP|nr:hypothetical protein CCACVL1_04577 [Corchorus capsularis]
MASSSSKASAPIALFLAFNLVFCTFVTSQIPPIPSFPGQVCAFIPAVQSIFNGNFTQRFRRCCNFLLTQSTGSPLNGLLCEIIQYVNTTLDEGAVTNATAAAANLGRVCRLTTTNLTCT